MTKHVVDLAADQVEPLVVRGDDAIDDVLSGWLSWRVNAETELRLGYCAIPKLRITEEIIQIHDQQLTSGQTSNRERS